MNIINPSCGSGSLVNSTKNLNKEYKIKKIEDIKPFRQDLEHAWAEPSQRRVLQFPQSYPRRDNQAITDLAETRIGAYVSSIQF
jgi:DTW domain-containing protein YfiP